MSWATVVNLHHKVPCEVYIGRTGHGKAGELGNPIAVDEPCIECGAVHGRSLGLLVCYGRWLARTIEASTSYRGAVQRLHGKVLGCFCVRADGSGSCHGKVLAREAARLHGDVWYRVGLQTSNNRQTASSWAKSYGLLEVTDSAQEHVYERWRFTSGRWASVEEAQLTLFA